MLQAFVITLREGLEAFLIVALSLAFLRKTGRRELVRAVYAGIVTALALSAVAGYLLFNASNQEWLEGPLAIIAAVSVTFLVVHMWRAGRRMKSEIEGRLSRSSACTRCPSRTICPSARPSTRQASHGDRRARSGTC